MWREWKLPLNVFNKSATPIHYNDNIIRFVGVNDDIMTAHGLESDLLDVNETMDISKETIDQLEQRCVEFYMYDYNPSAVDSYLFDMEKREDYRLFKTTIFDNKYAPLNSVQKVLSYAHPATDDWLVVKKYVETTLHKFGVTDQSSWEQFKEANIIRQTADKYMWEVYGLGLRAVGEDIIFPKWDTYTTEPDDSCLDWDYHGGDFGYKHDPTACVRVKKAGNNLYLRENFYEHGLLNVARNSDGSIADCIVKRLRDLDIADDRSIWDKAEEKSIFELRNAGVDAWYSNKGPGSVAFGIQKLHQFNLLIHSDSLHLQDEIRKYRWARDRQGNFKLDNSSRRKPVKGNDHCLDAARYVVLYNYLNTDED